MVVRKRSKKEIRTNKKRGVIDKIGVVINDKNKIQKYILNKHLKWCGLYSRYLYITIQEYNLQERIPFSNEPSRAIGRLVLSEKRRPENTSYA